MDDTRWDHGLKVTGEGECLVGHAGAVLPGFDIIRWAWRPGIAYDLGSAPWRAAGACL